MTQISSVGSRQFGKAVSPGIVDTAGGLLSKIGKPDVLVVVAICAVGLALTVIAAFSMPDFSDALTQIDLVGP